MSDSQAVDYYRLIRSRIEHEDSLITQRLSWFIGSQSFFFTAYAIVIVNARPGQELHALPVLIPLVALLSSAGISLYFRFPAWTLVRVFNTQGWPDVDPGRLHFAPVGKPSDRVSQSRTLATKGLAVVG